MAGPRRSCKNRKNRRSKTISGLADAPTWRQERSLQLVFDFGVNAEGEVVPLQDKERSNATTSGYLALARPFSVSGTKDVEEAVRKASCGSADRRWPNLRCSSAGVGLLPVCSRCHQDYRTHFWQNGKGSCPVVSHPHQRSRAWPVPPPVWRTICLRSPRSRAA